MKMTEVMSAFIPTKSSLSRHCVAKRIKTENNLDLYTNNQYPLKTIIKK